MADIHKLIRIQGNLLDSMVNISESIKRDTDKGFRDLDTDINELMRLTIIFDKLGPKYIGKD